MKISFRSAGTRELAVASFALVSAACSTAKVAPEGVLPTPVLERAINVTLPGMELDTDPSRNRSLRSQYNNNGKRAIGHIRARCVMRDRSVSPCPTVEVRITAVEGAKFINPADPPKNPQLLAWVENLGDNETADGFQSSTKSVYALVVAAPPPGDTAKEGIIYKVGFSTDAARSTITQERYGRVYRCHNYTPHLISEADFQPCLGRDMYGHNTGRPPLSVLVTALFSWFLSPGPGDPTWFSCSSGCCTSSKAQ